MRIACRDRPPLNFPRVAILRGGALTGTFHPNGVRRKDLTITADLFPPQAHGLPPPDAAAACEPSARRAPELCLAMRVTFIPRLSRLP
ncbi:hypothetical protein LFL96_29975 [Paraburkholderia sp. D15]|uniref:hypothetical protein n=1 Tax=Paraburkholderia sp. D15 TaxID=2880218 RepID=UPI0024786304|nr:hypothetical protein [Paraburkholderia sp. D15]WGS52423.1 hypothetical protein LFL96_29975 [Paraburkholderia sp. D15]WKF62171.1 hypothetical protein HUO10_006703 [Paraburkholderia busanensis]